jgi:Spy/CpxP family protein refolding chaperone
MFKKSLIVASVLILAGTSAVWAGEGCACQKPVPPCKCEKKFDPAKKAEFEKKRAEFEQRLQLTDEQKAQAKAIHEKAKSDIEPLVEQLKAKKAEFEAVTKSKLAPDAQNAKLDKLRAEKREIKAKMHEIRKNSMKEFEAILTPDQKKELAKMKEEGRQRFEERKGKKGGCGCKKPCKKSPDKK